MRPLRNEEEIEVGEVTYDGRSKKARDVITEEDDEVEFSRATLQLEGGRGVGYYLDDPYYSPSAFQPMQPYLI